MNKYLDAFAKKTPDKAAKGINRVVQIIRTSATKRATNINRRSGLAKGIQVENATLTKLYGIVYCNHLAGRYNEFGTSTRSEFPTAAYVIVPVKKKALSNRNSMQVGRSPFGPVKKVIHPGIPARPFMRPAAIEGIAKAVEIFGEEFRG